jgi:O-antigen/teichoic acid export membrane protein
LSIATALVLSLTGSLIFHLVFADRNISFYPYGLHLCGSGVFQALFRVHSTLLQSREKPEVFFWFECAFPFPWVAICIIVGLEIYPNSLAGPIIEACGIHYSGGVGLIKNLQRVRLSLGFRLVNVVPQLQHYNFIYQLQQWDHQSI